jgi:fumarylacetoacetase
VNGAVGFGVFSHEGGPARVGFRIGHGVLDLSANRLGEVFATPSLNAFLALGRSAWEDVVGRVVELVEDGADVVPLDDVSVHLPFEVADYVDFYSSLEHATNLGRLFRPDEEPLLPNWRHLPVGYHGRAGTVVVSGTPVVRPFGQSRAPDDPEPRFGPSRRLDYELELGFVVGRGSTLGAPVPATEFRKHVFGVVLVNDWSARDLQAWEYQPLGPFLGKSFATSIAAWVTPLALLEDRFVPGPEQDPEPLPHLRADGAWGLDVELDVEVGETVVSRTNTRGLYWTMPQQLAHATSNGASLRTGDLFASGTISGPDHGSEGSLIELTRNGEHPIRLGDGSTRTFLEDGDEVVLRGRAGDVELGEVRGTVLPPSWGRASA